MDVQQAIVEALKSRPDCTTDQLLGLMKQTGNSDVQRAIVKALESRVEDLRGIAGL